MNDLETAKQRRFDAELSEATGNDMPSDLASRVVAGIQRSPGASPAPAAGEPSRKQTVWLAAAGLLFGILVVASVASLRKDQDAMNAGQANAALQDPKLQNPNPQDPKAKQAPIAKMSNTSLQRAMKRAATTPLPVPGDTLERLLAIAESPSVNLVATAVVKGKSNVDLKGCTPREALERVAAECNLQVTEQRGALIVGGIGQSGRVGQRLTINCKSLPIRSFFKQVHEKIRVNFVVADDAVGLVQCDVRDVPWEAAVHSICNQLDLEAIGCGTVLAIRPVQPAQQQPQLRFLYKNHPVADILSNWAKVGGGNLVIGANITGKLTVKTNTLSLDGLLHGLSQAVRATIKVEGRGITRVEPANTDWSTDLILESGTVAQAFKKNGGGKSDAPAEATTKVSVFVRWAAGSHVIDAIRTATRIPAEAADKPKAGAGK